MTAPEDQSWLGRGFENVPGRPFGWAYHRERHEIREHLKRRGRYQQGWSELEISKIQTRLHRNKPSYAQRQATARERGERWVSPPPGPPGVIFTEEELAHIADHFAGANDPLARAIWHKAGRLDQKRGLTTRSPTAKP